MIEAVVFNDLPQAHRLKFNVFCQTVGDSEDPTAQNMATLPSLIRERFLSRGVLFVLFDGYKIIGCSGAYFSDFSPCIGLVGVRTWIAKEYRGRQLVREYLLPAQKAWMAAREARQIALTFNDHNRNLIELFKRQIVKRKPRQEHHMFYNDMIVLPYQVVVQNTLQWVMYENLVSDWSFDWSALKP